MDKSSRQPGYRKVYARKAAGNSGRRLGTGNHLPVKRVVIAARVAPDVGTP